MNEQNEENYSLKKTLLNSNTKKAVNKKLEIISQIPFFQDLPLNAFNLLLDKLKEKSYKKNEFVIKQNDSINNIFLILKGKFILSINHNVQFDIQHDINTFINYQNITHEPFNSDRNYEIAGNIKCNNELVLFIYHIKNFFGDIEMLANYNKSLFTIKALEDDSILGFMDRRSFWEIIEKQIDEYKNIVENKLEILQRRITDILNQKLFSNFDKLKLSKEKISYQLEVNHNYKLISEKLEEIKNNIINSKNKIIYYVKSKSLKSKSLNKKRNSLLNYNKSNKNIFNKNKKNDIHKSQSVADINNYEKKIMNLFQFPTVLKQDTKTIFDKFFDNIYDRKKIKKFNMTKIKFDYEPIYLNKFRNISKLEPQKEFEFLYQVKNHLEDQLRSPQNINNKNNTRQLFSMYNYYVTNKNKSKLNLKLSGYLTDKNKIINRSFGILNPKIKNNFIQKENTSSEKKSSILRKKPLKLETIKSNTSFLDTLSLTKNKNVSKKIKSNKLFFNSIISEEIKKNTFNWNPKISFLNNINNISNNNIKNDENNNSKFKENNENQIKKNKKKNLEKDDNNNNINLNKSRKSFSILQSFSDNVIFQNMKIKSKNIFEMMLKNKCETTKNRVLNLFQKKSIPENDNNDFFLKINNNIDIKKEDFMKNFFSKNKIRRLNTFGKIK